jgi:outer membrane protein assembly factor BamB
MKQNLKQIIAICLLISFAVSIAASLPLSNAQTTAKKTYAFISATPNPVGVGQETLLHIGISEATNGTYFSWRGLTVTMTKPDGTSQTLGPFNTDATGGTGYSITPDQVGTYTLQTHFPQQKMVPGFSAVERTYATSDSPIINLVVQQEALTYFPAFPLPTEYWNRPINAQFYEWAPLTGQWLRPVGSYSMPPIEKYQDGNADAPETAHILWTTPYAVGGMTGGEQGVMGYEMGDAYVGKFLGTVVINGVMYYNSYQATGGTAVEQTVHAVNLKTGEELWVRNWNNSRLALGQVYNFQGFNYYGAFAYLWTVTGTTWDAFDALTGRWVYRIANMSSATPNYNYFGERGEIIRYTVDTRNGWMVMWNSSKATNPQNAQAVGDGSWDVPGSIFDAKRGIQWNVTIPKGLPGSVCHAEVDDMILGSQSSAFPSFSGATITSWAISTKASNAGTLLFNNTWAVPAGTEEATWVWSDVSFEDRVFILSCKENIKFYGFNLDTGAYKWTTEPESYLQYYDKWYGPMHAYGMFYSERMSGTIIAYDIQTGQKVWNFNVTDPYSEILWSENFPTEFHFATDGKIYASYAEHSPNLSSRGAPMVCLNATTGEEIWRISWFGNWWGGTNVIGDSIMAGLNAGYDNRIYAFGKGASATSVEASPKVSTNGDKVLVEGYVTDIAPGLKKYDIAARFPNGVPAVSDASMTDFMQYVWMQYPTRPACTGVPVTIFVTDPNGNSYQVATATSDASGFYSTNFIPEVPGQYTIMAVFEGTKSFYGSNAETAINVGDEPQATATPTIAEETSTVEAYFVPAVIAIIAAIAIVGVVTMLMIKKRA